ncbi:MAG: carboxylesterase/lipase family protein [Gammaproteobacteria bacterium]|nr:carboxylesterase/lipase family protein [Gammaproteobacteria bacterium]
MQGLRTNGVAMFKGVPYGASTSGANRFMPPQKPVPWTGIRECFGYGPVSPQVPEDPANDYAALIQFDLNVALGGMGEDCLHLNIWAPCDAGEGEKRPVLVSLHGGGFAIGSGNAPIYDGAQLARFGNVVVVTVTHRLASFGFLDLADVGAPPEFAFAGVAGVMDLVAALEWIRDNIADFGGDPDRVMVFGQSGGGWRTSILLGTPAAKGLFHRAAVQSGSLLRMSSRETAARVARSFLAELGLNTRNIPTIQQIPWHHLLQVQTKLGAHAFAPVADGAYLPHEPFDPAAPDESRDVPLLISTTRDDASLFFQNFDLDETGLKEILDARFGEMSAEIYRRYRAQWPRKNPFLLQAHIVTDSGFRRFALAQAQRKVQQGGAPVYLYLWTWASPAYGGKFGAAHATDVAASFYNLRDGIVGAGSPRGAALCRRLASAWCSFARSGNPNNDALPAWPAFDTAKRSTMIFDDDTRVENDPDACMRQIWTPLPFPESVIG